MLTWDEERHALGIPAMDHTHREFLALAAEVRWAGAADFPGLFEALCRHTRDHFAHESELMRRCAFPAIAEHEGEHRRVLRLLEHLLTGVEEGRTTMARVYAREGLPEWFGTHLATMDAALAACLRRNPAAADAPSL